MGPAYGAFLLLLPRAGSGYRWRDNWQPIAGFGSPLGGTSSSKWPSVLRLSSSEEVDTESVTDVPFPQSPALAAAGQVSPAGSPLQGTELSLTVASGCKACSGERLPATDPSVQLLLGSGVGTVKLYDTDAKKNLYEMSIDDIHPRILSLACSPSGTSFVCSAAAQAAHSGAVTEGDARVSTPVSGQLLLWDTKTVKQQLQFALEPGPVAINCTAFNHNGNLLVTGAADGMIRLFDMQRYESALSWKAHDGEVYSVEFSYDENTVFSIGEDGKFVQWNIHRCGVKQSEYSLSQDAVGPFVLSGYSGYKQVQVPRGRLFAFDSEGQHVLTCSSSGGVIYRLNKADAGLESVLSLGGHKAPVVTVDWCSAMDCGTCLTASMDGKIKLSTLLAQKP
ncbi:WD repeat-containing protein 91-like [Garra rufa]|uniref:WD repeat-containing protein 91-like n=1 Tax=Garra rufa TaxID=137080 RepID=UPI003CCEE6EE